MRSNDSNDFLLLGEPGGQTLRVRFSGRFNGTTVQWDATLTTVEAAGACSRFIEVGDAGPEGRRVIIGLDVSRIDLPTVRKAVIMIRNYRRLRPGRHEFGRGCVLP